MATDFANKISNVRERRTGGPRLAYNSGFPLHERAATIDFADTLEAKVESKSFKYALLSMQEVDKRYTDISYSEAERVSKQLASGLKAIGKTVEIELQGSLPLNVHLRRISDVDMLVWPSDFFVYDSYGPAAGNYEPSTRTAKGEVQKLRSESVTVLSSSYPAANVDDSGSKCITMSGGSLLRMVDVVPSVLYKTSDFQMTNRDADRGVQILDRKSDSMVTNLPFKVRELINLKNTTTGGGCKKAIRLLKNMKEDSDDPISLSSFDIMSLVYKMADSDLIHHPYHQGKIIASLQSWFNYLNTSESVLRSLMAVDGSRPVVNSPQEVIAVRRMSEELNMLVYRIANELRPGMPTDFDQWRNAVSEALVI